MTNQVDNDAEILALANEIKEQKGVSLLEAMEIAEGRINRRGDEVDCVFRLEITLKPRVARFFRDSFKGHPSLTVEERLSIYLAGILNRLRGEALARTRAEAEIIEGKAHTIRRETFVERNLGS